MGYTIENTAVFDVNDTSKPSASYIFPSYGYTYYPMGNLACMDNDSIIFGGFDALYRFNINLGIITKYADYSDNYVINAQYYETSAISTSGDYNLLFGTGKSLTLLSYDISSTTFSKDVISLKGVMDPISAISSYNGTFYVSAGKKLYSVDNEGVLTKYIDGNEIAVKDGVPIGGINNFTFDPDGNIIFYDNINKSIRRINK
jgi:hypothetical protein